MEHKWEFITRDNGKLITGNVEQAVRFIKRGYWLVTELCHGLCQECEQLADTIVDMPEMVPAGCQCPHCTENRMDFLVLDDGDTVECLTCGTTYQLRTGLASSPLEKDNNEARIVTSEKKLGLCGVYII